MARPSFRVHLVTHHDGKMTGRLLSSAGALEDAPSGYGNTEDEVLNQLSLILEEKPALVHNFLWTDHLSTRKVKVSVHPQAVVKRRHVIGRDSIQVDIGYAWAELDKGGHRVIVPRFGWWFIVEDMEMAPAVIKQAVSSAMLGQNARSLFDMRSVGEERIVEWSPNLSKGLDDGAAKAEEEANPTLHSVAEDLSERDRGRRRRPIVGEVDLRRYLPLATRQPPRSLLVVGAPGIGKSTWVRALTRALRTLAKMDKESDEAPTVWATSADRIVAGMKYLGQWEQRCLDLIAELSGEGDYLYVDRLASFCAPRSGATSIAAMFQSAIASGEVSLIAECSEEELVRLTSQAPAFIALFHLVRLQPPQMGTLPMLMRDYQAKVSAGVEIEAEGLRRLVQHLEFFQRDSGFPGKAFRFLDWLAGQRETESDPSPRMTADQVSEAFARSTGLPLELISDAHVAGPEKIAERLEAGVIGQDAACRTSARVLTRFKAGLGDTQRPIGSLFFVGPTGVGKTELAKQLARYMFGDASRMIRLDMSEYMLRGAAQRILAVGQGVRSLVERVRQSPLSIILLDEIEKAHPEVFDLLLAMLGEGRMTDTDGRLVDFRMTLVVMTSNLGVQDSAATGFGADASGARDLLTAVRQHFRPEFFNRIDHVVPFRNLSVHDILQVVDLEFKKAGTRAGLQRRGLRLRVSEGAREILARDGWHPSRGARPLKRVIEERVMAPLAIRLAGDPTIGDRGVRDRVVWVLTKGETPPDESITVVV